MLRAGLTGGIGCGKSTVGAMMRELGCHVVEADKIAHEVIQPGRAAYVEVVQEFGIDCLTPEGYVDRAKLAAVVFSDAKRLERLNSIVHPRVLEEEDRALDRIRHDDPQGVAVVEAALLVESGFYKRLDRLVVVWCTPEQQIERLTGERFGRRMSREQAERRIASQMDFAEKRKLATDEIDNSQTLDQTREQVVALVERFKQFATKK